MSDFNALNPQETYNDIEARKITDFSRSFVRVNEVGVLESLGRSVISGSVRVGATIDAYGAIPLGSALYDATGYEPLSPDQLWKEHEQTFGLAKKAITPKADEVTTAGQVAFGLGQGLTELLAGGPATLVATEQANTALELVAQGVDSKTAQGAGLIAGVANAVGVALPVAVGKTLLTKAGTGVGMNTVAGAGADAGQQQLFRQRGYGERADQMNPLDLTARSVDALMGAAFGGMAHLGAPPAKPSEKHAAATLNLAAQAESAAPGIPADFHDMTSHVNAFGKAQDDLMNNRPVDVATELNGAQFKPDMERERVQMEVAGAVDAAASELRTVEPERFLTPDEVQAIEHEQLLRDQMKIVGITATESQLKAFAKGTDLGALRDEVTGLYEARVSVGGKNARITAIERLQALAKETGADSTYIHADIQNLGGLNKHLNEVGANKVFKAFSQFLDEEARKIPGGRAVSFRHGGDEISAVVLNADPVMTDRAMQAAARRAREYATGIKTEDGTTLTEIPHAKAPKNIAKRGTGVTYSVAKIIPGKKPGEIIEVAAKQLEDMKDVRPEQSQRAGDRRNDAGAAKGEAGRDPVKVGRSGQGMGGREGAPVSQQSEAAVARGVDEQTLIAAEQAITENPSALAIDETTGDHVLASEYFAKLDNEIQDAQRKRDAFAAAAGCFLRNGGF